MSSLAVLVIIVSLVIIILLCDRYEGSLPTSVKWIYALWKKFARVLGVIMNTIILTVFWIVAIGSYAIILRIVAIPKLWQPKPATYWRDAEPQTPDSMKHQF